LPGQVLICLAVVASALLHFGVGRNQRPESFSMAKTVI